MMLVLTPHDLQKMSAACRVELMRMLSNEHDVADLNYVSDAAEGEGSAETEEVVNEEKKVVSLTIAEAGDLLGNISDRSSQTLRHFALGQPVPLEALVGQGKSYKNYIELKRSFVGAVNRRLRTVSGNRNAALFSSDREQTLIRVKPKTAQSLRRAFAMPEPFPEMDFCNQFGQDLEPSNPQCQELSQKLDRAWQEIDSNHLPEGRLECVAFVLRHFIDCGLALCVRLIQSWDQDADMPIYEIHTVANPYVVIENWLTEHAQGDLLVGLPGDPSVLAQPKV